MDHQKIEAKLEELWSLGSINGSEPGGRGNHESAVEAEQINKELLDVYDVQFAELERLDAIRQLAGIVIQPAREGGYELIGNSKFHGSLMMASRHNGKLPKELLPEAVDSRLALAYALADAVAAWKHAVEVLDNSGVDEAAAMEAALEEFRKG